MKSIFRKLKKKLNALWMRLRWWWAGGLLSVKLEDKTSETRTDAELAVERIVFQTSIPHDCVVATVQRGGPCIIVRHDKAQEGFIGNSYAHAADKAIEWLTKREGRFISTDKTTKLSRKSIKVFDAQRRSLRTAKKRRH